MVHYEQNGENKPLTGQACLLRILALGLLCLSAISFVCLAGLVGAHFLNMSHPRVGETVEVVASRESEYTIGNGVRATVTYEDFAIVRDGQRAGDKESVEAVEKRGSLMVLDEGELVTIVANELLFEEVYQVLVATGPHAGKKLFISWSNVRRISQRK